MSLISNALSDLLGTGGDSWQWSERLHPASFRGVPFAVLAADGVFGRRQAIHEYPYRDTAWIEDLGRATRSLTIRGFLIQSSGLYNAPDVMTQRDSLIAACEMPDAGTLVHSTLGQKPVIPDYEWITYGERVMKRTLRASRYIKQRGAGQAPRM